MERYNFLCEELEIPVNMALKFKVSIKELEYMYRDMLNTIQSNINAFSEPD